MMKTTQLPDLNPAGHGRAKARWARALVGAAVLALLAPPAWATRVTDVRVGKHPTFTRVVFELDRPSGYQLERNEPAPGIAELVVSLRASSSQPTVVAPKNSLIERIEIRSDGKNTTAHIRLTKGGLRIKEMMFSDPARIVLDVVDPSVDATAKPKTAFARVAPVAAAVPKTVDEPVPVPEIVAEEIGSDAKGAREEGASPASPSRYGSDAVAQTQEIMEFTSNEGPSDPTAPSATPEPVVLAKREPIKIAMATPEKATPVAPKPRTTTPAESSTNMMNPPEAGVFSMRNGAYALAGVGLLGSAVYVMARRRRDDIDYEDDYDEEVLSDDNPFAGLGSAAPAEEAGAPLEVSAYPDTVEEGGIDVVGVIEDGQTDLFAATPSAAEQAQDEPEIVVDGDAGASESNESNEETTAAAATEGSDMSFDGMTDSGGDPNAVTTMPAMGGADNDAVMRLIREMETRIGDVETRLEETVDAKERLERQVVAQTEELRVQRAAIARTQRAVRNMRQPVENTPTEPALRDPRGEDQ